jgi:hypothetical protein
MVMSFRALGACALLLLATPAQAGKPFDVHGLIIGNEGARYVKGVPTLDLQQQRGAIELRSLGFYNNHPMFAIAFYNAGPEPMNIGLEDIHAAANGTQLRVFPVEELERQAKHKAWWSQFAIAMLGGVSAGLSASRRDTYHSTITGPYGTYTLNASYPSLAGQLQAENISLNTAYSIAAIQYQLDRTIELINDHVVQRTTIDPGSTYGGLIIMDKLKQGDPPFELHLDVDWNGERYPFAYVMQKPGRPVPDRYNPMLAEHAKPRALNAMFAGHAAQSDAAPQPAYAPPKKVDGAIFLSSGVVKIPAKTASGYCLKAPDDYVATGAANSPVITGALPRCLDDSGKVEAHKESAFRPYRD